MYSSCTCTCYTWQILFLFYSYLFYYVLLYYVLFYSIQNHSKENQGPWEHWHDPVKGSTLPSFSGLAGLYTNVVPMVLLIDPNTCCWNTCCWNTNFTIQYHSHHRYLWAHTQSTTGASGLFKFRRTLRLSPVSLPINRLHTHRRADESTLSHHSHQVSVPKPRPLYSLYTRSRPVSAASGSAPRPSATPCSAW